MPELPCGLRLEIFCLSTTVPDSAIKGLTKTPFTLPPGPTHGAITSIRLKFQQVGAEGIAGTGEQALGLDTLTRFDVSMILWPRLETAHATMLPKKNAIDSCKLGGLVLTART
jgi:hypothetical protein